MSQEDPDDQTLLKAFGETRSEAAFTAIVRRHLPLVFHTARRRLGSAALAEEAAQSAFARLAVKVAVVSRHPERLRAWLCRAAYLEACQIARKESRQSRLPLEAQPHQETMNSPERYDRLEDALQTLPELERELLLRHCCAGEDYHHIARAVGISPAACQKRVERALGRLAKTMGGGNTKTTASAVGSLLAPLADHHALPAAESVARAALAQSASAGAALGTFGGLHTAACATLALAGALGGWSQRQHAAAFPPPGPAIAQDASRSHSPTPAHTIQRAEIAAPISSSLTLPEILETIQAGRLAPFIAFLPEATAEDLCAVMIEDDFAGLSEGSGNHGPAYWLALRRWTEMNPLAAFDFAFRRDCQNNGTWLNRSAAVLGWWQALNPHAALAAYRELPAHHRRILVLSMLDAEPALADELAEADDEVRWVVAYRKATYPPPKPTPSIVQDRRTLEKILSSKPESASPARMFLIHRMAARDAMHLQTQIPRITDPEFRAMALFHLQPRETITPQTPHEPSDPWAQLDAAIRNGKSPTPNLLSFLGEQDATRVLATLPLVAKSTGDASLVELTESVLTGWLRKDPASALRWAAEANIWLSRDVLEHVGGDLAAVIRLIPGADDRLRSRAIPLITRHLAENPADTRIRALVDGLPEADREAILSKLPATP